MQRAKGRKRANAVRERRIVLSETGDRRPNRKMKAGGRRLDAEYLSAYSGLRPPLFLIESFLSHLDQLGQHRRYLSGEFEQVLGNFRLNQLYSFREMQLGPKLGA